MINIFQFLRLGRYFLQYTHNFLTFLSYQQQNLPFLKTQQMQNQSITRNDVGTSGQQTLKDKVQRLEKKIDRYDRFFFNFFQKALVCPISLQYMENPVLTSSGITYEKVQLQDYLRINRTNIEPISKVKLSQAQIQHLTPNKCIKSLIDEYKTFLKNQAPQKLVKFNQDPNRMSITEYQKSQQGLIIDFTRNFLNHNFRRVQMKQFLKCDWRYFRQMDLSSCQIDDKAVELMLRKGHKKFMNLHELNLADNNIKKMGDLRRFTNLKLLNLQRNPLSVECLQYLKKISQESPKIKIIF